jgi:hypothetical protein
MGDDTITFMHALCAKAKEVATLCDAYLEQQSKKNITKKELQSQSDGPGSIGNRLIPISKWPHYHPWPTANGLRHLIFTSYSSGADYFVRKGGRRLLLICEKSFFEWANMTEERRIEASPDARRWKDKFRRR